MFGKGPKENQPAEKFEIQDVKIPPESNKPAKSPPTIIIEDEEEEDKPQIVILVEKISGILSPYFIVLVGLYLYKNNFLLGTILITVGIFSLLKISGRDINKFFDWLKQVLGYDKSEDV